MGVKAWALWAASVHGGQPGTEAAGGDPGPWALEGWHRGAATELSVMTEMGVSVPQAQVAVEH